MTPQKQIVPTYREVDNVVAVRAQDQEGERRDERRKKMCDSCYFFANVSITLCCVFFLFFFQLSFKTLSLWH